MKNIFLDVTVVIPVVTLIKGEKDHKLECHKVANLNTPAVQNILFYLEEGHLLKIKNLGLLSVKSVDYTAGGGLTLVCKRLRKG